MRRTAIIASLIFGSYGSIALSDEKADLADRIHSFVMERIPEYVASNESKVMAACIEWDEPYLHNVFSYRTDPNSDAPIFTSRLQQLAMLSCKRWAKSEKIDCTCQMLDKNGKNVLRVP